MLMNEQQVHTLMEALPYLSNFKDKTIVVKYGGNAMLNDELKNKVLQDILFLPVSYTHLTLPTKRIV